MRNPPPESEEQKKLVQYLKLKKYFFFAINNENNTFKQDRRYAMINEMKARANGKIKGASDIVVFLPTQILFIELKRRPKQLKTKLSYSHTKVSVEQEQFLHSVNLYEYANGAVCYGADEAIKLIEEKR